LPDSTRLWELLDPEGDEINAKFAELVKCMYERGLGWQSHHFRVQNLAIERLKKKLLNADTGSHEFEVTEKLLITMQDLKLRNQINELRIGEVLSSEKPSKHFLDIASCKKSVSKLEDIRQENGDEFKCPVERAKYISKF
jgi:GH35 family endo-1,4-beta-xylanase